MPQVGVGLFEDLAHDRLQHDAVEEQVAVADDERVSADAEESLHAVRPHGAEDVVRAGGINGDRLLTSGRADAGNDGILTGHSLVNGGVIAHVAAHDAEVIVADVHARGIAGNRGDVVARVQGHADNVRTGSTGCAKDGELHWISLSFTCTCACSPDFTMEGSRIVSSAASDAMEPTVSSVS